MIKIMKLHRTRKQLIHPEQIKNFLDFISYYGYEDYSQLYLEKKLKTELYKSTSNRGTLRKFGCDYESGIPDFFFIKDNKLNFIECKANGYGLSDTQIKWFCKHQEKYDIIIFYLVVPTLKRGRW